MPNYEELYYAARNKFNSAVNSRNEARKKKNAWTSQKNAKYRELATHKASLLKNAGKKALLESAAKKCASILASDGPFLQMKTNLGRARDEYIAILESDEGVADIYAIYEDDINRTEGDLDKIHQEIQSKLNACIDQETYLNSTITKTEDAISTLTSNVKKAEADEAYAQRQVNTYYTTMQEYKRKWENGE